MNVLVGPCACTFFISRFEYKHSGCPPKPLSGLSSPTPTPMSVVKSTACGEIQTVETIYQALLNAYQDAANKAARAKYKFEEMTANKDKLQNEFVTTSMQLAQLRQTCKPHRNNQVVPFDMHHTQIVADIEATAEVEAENLEQYLEFLDQQTKGDDDDESMYQSDMLVGGRGATPPRRSLKPKCSSSSRRWQTPQAPSAAVASGAASQGRSRNPQRTSPGRRWRVAARRAGRSRSQSRSRNQRTGRKK